MNAIGPVRTVIVEPHDDPAFWQAVAALTIILTRCDDLDAMTAPDGVMDREQIARDCRRIRAKAEEARALLAGRVSL